MFLQAHPIPKPPSNGVAAVVQSPQRVTEFPKDVEAMAEIIVTTFEDTDDIEMLHRMICKAILADRDKVSGVLTKRNELAARRAAMTPEELAEHKRTIWRRQRHAAQANDPERMAERAREKVRRARLRDPEKVRAKELRKLERRKVRLKTDPAYREVLNTKARKKWVRRWCKENPAKLSALMEASVPNTYGPAMRIELVSMLTERYMTGEFRQDDLKSALKLVVTAYWKNNPSKFGPQSLDAERFDDGNSTLHDTVSKSLWQ